jgi:hypothetical protein
MGWGIEWMSQGENRVSEELILVMEFLPRVGHCPCGHVLTPQADMPRVFIQCRSFISFTKTL